MVRSLLARLAQILLLAPASPVPFGNAALSASGANVIIVAPVVRRYPTIIDAILLVKI